MALIISKNGIKTIKIKGTDISVDSVYLRLAFYAPADGTKINIGYYSYLNKSEYEDSNLLQTTVPTETKNYNLENKEEQTLEIAHIKSKSYYESLGYEVTIKM